MLLPVSTYSTIKLLYKDASCGTYCFWFSIRVVYIQRGIQVTKHHNIIELNGKKYDAKTGHIVSATQREQKTPSKVNHASSHNGHSIDGVVGGRRKSMNQPANKKSTKQPRTHTPKHISHHKTQKSQSLMRSAVKKPASEPKHEVLSRSQNRARLHRAKNTPMSSHIGKFTPTETKISTKLSSVPLAQAPAISAEQAQPSTPSQQPHHQAHKLSASQKHFEAALSKSHAHKAKPTKKQKRGAKLAKKLGISHKILNVSAAMLATVLLVGFFTYQNLASLSMQVASSRAGFEAQLPGYKPAGYGLAGPIEYEPGTVSVSFVSRTDDSNLKLTQEVSNWNSEALQENFLGQNSSEFQARQEKGKTIYIYDGNNATWVSGGVWYRIESNSLINTDQLVQMANSIR